MIGEYLSYLFHSFCCPQYLKDIGILHELVAVESRAKRCHQAWQSHIEKTRNIIKSKANSKAKVLILGSSLINDIPLDELASNCKEVILLDLIFMQSTINECKKYSNINFIELDISNILKSTYLAVNKFKKNRDYNELHDSIQALIHLVPQDFILDAEIDLVISVNLLSQLPLSLKIWIDKQKLDYDFNQIYKSMIINHLNYLKQLHANGKEILLISDTSKEVLDQNDFPIASETSLEEVKIKDHFRSLNLIDQWDWLLAPLGEIDKEYQMRLKVEAYSSS